MNSKVWKSFLVAMNVLFGIVYSSSCRAPHIHHKQCCIRNRKNHDILQDMALNREHRLDMEVNGSNDYLKKILLSGIYVFHHVYK